MADGVSEHQNILTIGFLNDQVRQFEPGVSSIELKLQKVGPSCLCCVSQVGERKESYVNSFDVVLVKDETMDVPNAILKYITSSKNNK